MSKVVIEVHSREWYPNSEGSVISASIPTNMFTELNENVMKLEAVDPALIVAGGCLRDWVFGKKVNDIDIFMNSHYNPAWWFEMQLRRAGFIITSKKSGENIPQDYKLNPDIRAVYEVKPAVAYHCLLKYQIICMKADSTTFGIVEKFPIDICQLWWKPNHPNIHCTKSFAKAVESGVSLNLNPVYANGHFYLEKVKEKYKGMFEFKF